MLGEADTRPEYSFDFAKRYSKDASENCWSIDSEDSFDRVATEIIARIAELAEWADGPITYADLVSAYENEQSSKRVAAAKQAAEKGEIV